MASMPTPATVLLATGEAQEEVIPRQVMGKATVAAPPTQLQLHKMEDMALPTGLMEEQIATR
jgi:hypothetical protein